jgi:hypothetical protein
VGWYESGIRKTKALPTKALAEHYRQIKYTQLNSDVFTGTVTVDRQQMRDEYEHSKKVAGITEDSLYEVATRNRLRKTQLTVSYSREARKSNVRRLTRTSGT